jgi:hypothetical protein
VKLSNGFCGMIQSCGLLRLNSSQIPCCLLQRSRRNTTILPLPVRGFLRLCHATDRFSELTNPKSSQYPALLDALFDQPSHAYSASFDNRLDDYTYDNDHDDQLQVWLTAVISRLTDLLQRHGAVETYLPLLMPETTLLTAFPDLSPVRLLDHGGKIVQLPASDLLGMARQAARKQIERIKRYHVGRKYTDHPVGGQPRVSGELRCAAKLRNCVS